MQIDKTEFNYQRQIARMTVRDVAKLLGISTQAVYKKINGKAKWTVDEYYQIRSAFNLSEEKALEIFFAEEVAKMET